MMYFDTKQGPVFRQQDPRWCDELLAGEEGHTIGEEGCAVTCIAQLLVWLGWDVNPSIVNQRLQDKHCFSGAMLRWECAAQAYAALDWIGRWDWDEAVPSAQLKEVRGQIARYGAIIAEVDFYPGSGTQDQHFVIAIAYGEDDLLIVDPWIGRRRWLCERYGTHSQKLKYALWGTRVYAPLFWRHFDFPVNSLKQLRDSLVHAQGKLGDGIAYVDFLLRYQAREGQGEKNEQEGKAVDSSGTSSNGPSIE